MRTSRYFNLRVSIGQGSHTLTIKAPIKTEIDHLNESYPCLFLAVLVLGNDLFLDLEATSKLLAVIFLGFPSLW